MSSTSNASSGSSMKPQNGSAYSIIRSKFTSQGTKSNSSITASSHKISSRHPPHCYRAAADSDYPPSEYTVYGYEEDQNSSVSAPSPLSFQFPETRNSPSQPDQKISANQYCSNYGDYYVQHAQDDSHETEPYSPEIILDGDEDFHVTAPNSGDRHEEHLHLKKRFAQPRHSLTSVPENSPFVENHSTYPINTPIPTNEPSSQPRLPQQTHPSISLHRPSTPPHQTYPNYLPEDEIPLTTWSNQSSPEERLRLGLPRWESEYQREAYERKNRN